MNVNVFGDENIHNFRDKAKSHGCGNHHTNTFEDQYANANYSNPFSNFGKNSNNTPPRTPRCHLEGYVSPPRHSHHGQPSHR